MDKKENNVILTLNKDTSGMNKYKEMPIHEKDRSRFYDHSNAFTHKPLETSNIEFDFSKSIHFVSCLLNL